jgi:5-(carboxyamino)imidazole ribonucleotide synthase
MKKLGILGGGQLGKMMCLAAADWDLETFVLDTEGSPAQPYCKHFEVGDFKNYDDVVRFGRKVDVLTVEIEHVNIDALKTLEDEGITVHPTSSALETVNDKGLQKAFFKRQGIPTADFKTFDSKGEMIDYLKSLVAANATSGVNVFHWVWKARKGGYDGKGVAVIKNLSDAQRLPDVPCILEEPVPISAEIAVMLARNARGEVKAYDAVRMFFNEQTNMLDMQSCPAQFDKELLEEAVKYGETIIKQLGVCGVLAVELFIVRKMKGKTEILVNEVAPRPHNSGHHTIEAAETSQFQQHIRGVLNLPLGSTSTRFPSYLLNLVGEDGYEGVPKIEGFEKGLHTEGVHFHFYGKSITKPFRKMGHVTVVHRFLGKARAIAWSLKETIKIVSES